MNDRHNIANLNDGAALPFYGDATANDLGLVIERLTAIAPELTAPVVTEELRLAQYRRAAELGAWIAQAADDLAAALQTELNRQKGQS